MQGGGAVQHRGGANYRNDEDYADMYPEEFTVVRWR
jgi:hypothetical protein